MISPSQEGPVASLLASILVAMLKLACSARCLEMSQRKARTSRGIMQLAIGDAEPSASELALLISEQGKPTFHHSMLRLVSPIAPTAVCLSLPHRSKLENSMATTLLSTFTHATMS